MPKTFISDLVTPDAWAEYGVNRTAELSAFWQSGIVANVPGIVIPSAGGTVNMPFFNDLTGTLQNLSGITPLVVGNITANKDVSVVIGRGQAWSVNDLAAVLSGTDPLRAIIDLIAGYWAREMQKELLNLLTGAFSAASMSVLISDVSALGTEALRSFNQNTFIDATQLLGDAKSNVGAIAMHSATQGYLDKQQMIVYETTADKSIQIPRYLGKRIIVDDGLPVSSGTYTSYLFGEGAVGFAEDTVGDADLETDRDILAGDTVLAMRRRFLLHPRGIKWQGTPVAEFPSRAELAVGTNWARVFSPKQLRIVQFKHKLA